jgi:HEPN domain-containing protein
MQTVINDEIRKALIDERYPLAAKYDPDWIFENKMGDQCLRNLEALFPLLV